MTSRLVKLTNLGNLALLNLVNINEGYSVNSRSKQAKLAKLWPSERAMNTFKNMFAPYHLPQVEPILVKDESGYLKQYNSGASRLDYYESNLIEEFRKLNLVELGAEDMSFQIASQQINVLKRQNPIKHIHSAIIELTGLCNLNCRHCYRGGSRNDEFGLSVKELKGALEPLLMVGIDEIMLTGGEPTLRREDLLELVTWASQFMVLQDATTEEKMRYTYGIPSPSVDDVLETESFLALKRKLMGQLALPKSQIKCGDRNICNENTVDDVLKMLSLAAEASIRVTKNISVRKDSITILTNGCFTEQRELVTQLKEFGNVILQTSLDSYNEEITDSNRGRKGVFSNVKQLVAICKEAGVDLDITALNMGGVNTEGEKANKNYFEKNTHVIEFNGLLQLANARSNGFTQSASLEKISLGDLNPAKRPHKGWCKGFTHPDTIHIRPNGNVGNCLYAYAVPEEFGNIHQTSMAGILNRVQDSRIYQMFMDGRIEQYQHELDKTLFSREFVGSCEAIILTLTYGQIKERLIAEGATDPIQIANQQVAEMYGFKKAGIPADH
ncbi:MAG: radical SAM protein [Candidatus Micrarchaeia archaeon]